MISETVINYINSLGISCKIFSHSPAFSMDECEKIALETGTRLCKNLFLKTTSGSNYYLLMMHPDKKFVTSKVSKLLCSSRLSFASGEEMTDMLRTSPGSLSIMSLIFSECPDITLAIDSDVLKDEYICCHPCDNSQTLKIKTCDILNTLIPSFNVEYKIIDID